MKAIAAILLLAMTGAAQAETDKPADQPITVYKGGKPYIFDGMRRMAPRVPHGFRSEAPDASPDSAQDKPAPEKAPALKRRS